MPPTKLDDHKLVTKDSPAPFIAPRSPEQQSWGTIVSLVVIVMMIVVGALYAWGKRVAEQNALIEQIEAQQF